MQTPLGRPKDLEKRARILEAAKTIFLKMGYHGTTMNQIALEAQVTKLTVYNHFKDKDNLFTCAIEKTCEESMSAAPIQLDAQSNFSEVLTLICHRILHTIYLPEAIKLEHVLFELAAENNPLAIQFFNASHLRVRNNLIDFFKQASSLDFIRLDDPVKQTDLIMTLLLGVRYHQVLLGIEQVPNESEMKEIIHNALQLFLMKYAT